MTPARYKAILKLFGLTQEGAGQWLGVSPRTGQNYALNGPPRAVAILLRLMIRLKLRPKDVS